MAHPPPKPSSGPFNQEMADAYDRRNAGLKPVSDCLHFLMRLTLAQLPEKAKVLCVGVGTGAEIFALASERPNWTFVGVDPSAEMLGVADYRLKEAGIGERCTLVEGYVEDVVENGFDVAVSLLVAHFVERADRPAFYRAIHDRLVPGGRFLSAEISCDFDSPAFHGMLEDWKRLHRMMGTAPEALASLDQTLREELEIVPPSETESLWRDAGFSLPTPFFQAFLIRGWHALKP